MLVGGQGGGHPPKGVLILGMGPSPGGALNPWKGWDLLGKQVGDDRPVLPDLLFHSPLGRPQPLFTLFPQHRSGVREWHAEVSMTARNEWVGTATL